MPKVDTNGHKQKIINPKTWRLINGWEVLIKHPLINDFRATPGIIRKHLKTYRGHIWRTL